MIHVLLFHIVPPPPFVNARPKSNWEIQAKRLLLFLSSDASLTKNLINSRAQLGGGHHKSAVREDLREYAFVGSKD